MENYKTLTVEKIEKVIDSKNSASLMECIKSLEIKAVPIGEGGNAIVYAALGTAFEKVCLKRIKEKPQIIFNDIEQEHDFQVKAQEAGVRTPLSLLSINTDYGKYLIMERIIGHSVGEIVKDPDLLPKNFDTKKFCESLDEQISKMHKHGIYHRDLHENNVMIDDKDGLPVFIDFGTATEGTGSNYTYSESVSMYDPIKGRYTLAYGFFKDDLMMIRNIKSSINKLILR